MKEAGPGRVALWAACGAAFAVSAAADLTGIALGRPVGGSTGASMIVGMAALATFAARRRVRRHRKDRDQGADGNGADERPAGPRGILLGAVSDGGSEIVRWRGTRRYEGPAGTIKVLVTTTWIGDTGRIDQAVDFVLFDRVTGAAAVAFDKPGCAYRGMMVLNLGFTSRHDVRRAWGQEPGAPSTLSRRATEALRGQDLRSPAGIARARRSAAKALHPDARAAGHDDGAMAEVNAFLDRLEKRASKPDRG